LYGGTERVVSYLTEALVALGHDVTLFASGDSQTAARLVAPCTQALRLGGGCVDPLAHLMVMLEKVFQRAGEFDIIHFHIDYLHFSLSRRFGPPTVTTLHGRLDIADLVPIYTEFSEMPVVSISDAQRTPLPFANWVGTVPHGLPDGYHYREGRGGYLAFLGRISPEKRLDRAIEIARRAKKKLKVAAKVDSADLNYFNQKIAPLIKQQGVEFIGEIGEAQKEEFLGEATALLFPIDWPEPFGLVMIEAMACGTPVIAYRRGSAPEVVTDGVSGFVVNDVNDAVEAVRWIAELDRRECRAYFEERFTAERMARDYLDVYAKLCGHSATADLRHESSTTAA
jgi:glycosyltransferase involved in cell wall biosynthesis